MNDNELDRELAELVNPSPTPGFPTRIRARLDEERLPAQWPFSGVRAAVAASALAAAAAVAVTIATPHRPETVEPEDPMARTAARAHDIALAPIVVPESRPLESPQPLTSPGLAASRRGATPGSEAAVIVSPEEAAGIRLLAATALDEHSAAAMPADATVSADTAIPEPEPISVTPMSIEPLTPLSH